MSKKQNGIHPWFAEYFRETFFAEKPEEFESFMKNITKPLPKTIRINTNRISLADFKTRAGANNWQLTWTPNPTVFRIDRDDTSMPLGHTLEHLLGYFYIQELSASMSVHYLTNGEIDREPYTILDMAASPGGKTTQLSEHFPNAFIVGNEPARDRTAQIVSNVERMGKGNIALSNYDGIFFGELEETFDRVLLDAPCSGEGIGFKAGEALKFWNIKNIKKIARLQEKLLDAGFRALKTGGEMLYSTCTLNNIENEGVVNAIRAKYPESFEVLFEKRFWPHLEETGGFFVCRIRKNAPIEQSEDQHRIYTAGSNKEIISLDKNDYTLIERFENLSGADFSWYYLFRFKRDILAIEKHASIKPLMEQIFFIRLGKRIGRIEDGTLTPDNRLGRDFALPRLPTYTIPSAEELDHYLRREEIGNDLSEWYYQTEFSGLGVSLECANKKSGKLGNTFPREWMRG